MKEITDERKSEAVIRFASILLTSTEFTTTQRATLTNAFRGALNELFKND